MPNKSPDVDAYIDALEGDAHAVAKEIRAAILTAAPQASESFKWGRPCYALDQPFCYFKAGKKHITLGFDNGALLEDADGVLEGTGKSMRHVKLPLQAGAVSPSIEGLIQRAAKEA